MGGKPGMTSCAGIRHGMIPINVGKYRDESERVDRMEDCGHNENYAHESCCRKASDIVRDAASS